MKIIGVTGNIASGKSSISNIISKYYNIPYISVDDFSRNWINTFPLIAEQIIKEHRITLGESIKSTIIDNIFINENFRKHLEDIVSVFFWRYIECLSAIDHKTILIEHPIMFERKENNRFDVIIGVVSRTINRAARMEQRGYTIQQMQQRHRAQIPFDLYEDQVDIVLDNNNLLTLEEITHALSNSEKFRTAIS